MANNFLNQLQMVVDTGKLQGVTNIKDLYEHFKDSGINYKDFKKQMHDYGIYGHLGKHDMARLSGMYYGSKKGDWEAKKPENLTRTEFTTLSTPVNVTLPNDLPLLNVPVKQPITQKTTVIKSTPKKQNTPAEQQVVETTKTIIPEAENFTIDPEWFKDWYGVFSFNRNPQGLIPPNSVRKFNEILMKNNYKGHLLTPDEMRNLDNWDKIYNMIKYNNPNAKLYQTNTSKLPAYQHDGGTLNKFQTGGKTKQSSQNDAVMQFVQAIAQTLQADPKQVIEVAQSNPDALKSAVQVYQETQDIKKAAQAFTQAAQEKTKAAKHGAKLDYIKSLKNKCAEDEELVYFKKGGSVGCGCVKKNQDGGKTDKKESLINKFKKDVQSKKDQTVKDSTKLNPKTTKNLPNGKYPSNWTADDKVIWERENGPKDEGAHYAKENKCGGKMKKKACGGIKMKFVKKGDKVKSAGAGCIAKFKLAYKNGGSLNGIPFYQEGTIKNGIKKIVEPITYHGILRGKREYYQKPSIQYPNDSVLVLRQIDSGHNGDKNDTIYGMSYPTVNNTFPSLYYHSYPSKTGDSSIKLLWDKLNMMYNKENQK